MNLGTALLFLSVRCRPTIVACEEARLTTALDPNKIRRPIFWSIGTNLRVGQELAATTDRASAEAPIAAISAAHLGRK
jgi:hypothetical protein